MIKKNVFLSLVLTFSYIKATTAYESYADVVRGSHRTHTNYVEDFQKHVSFIEPYSNTTSTNSSFTLSVKAEPYFPTSDSAFLKYIKNHICNVKVMNELSIIPAVVKKLKKLGYEIHAGSLWVVCEDSIPIEKKRIHSDLLFSGTDNISPPWDD